MFHVSDSAMGILVLFFWHFFRLCSNICSSEHFSKLWEVLPRTYSGLLKLLGLELKHCITLFVICPKCNSVYDYDSSYEVQCNKKVSKRCKFVAFPDHTHRNKRQPCGALLLKEVKSQNKSDLIPFKAYPYHSLKDAIALLVERPNFLSMCEQWRKRKEHIPANTLADVYDGDVWLDFLGVKYHNFLNFPGNIVLSLNIDWFQPFTHTQYSVGALYLVVLNLPREERYKIENIILVGIIPGPKEPKLTVNSYIAPLVQELNNAYQGWIINTKHSTVKTVRIRACLGCVTCDIPASRKICGFLGHTARLGCNKCLKEFPTASFGEKPNFAGYDRDQWILRTVSSHRASCAELLAAKNQTHLQSLESKHGLRYSVALELSYFDPVRFTVVDPMHNLLLGTAKHTFTLWVKRNLLSTHDLDIIQDRSEKIFFPSDVGRLPLKIGSGFSGFTADQWRVWTTVLSPIVLKGILPDQDLACWLLFVRACSLLCSRIISKSNIETADQYLLLFCKKYQNLYGNEACTPNMHLHTHLAKCLQDYGPVHSFWCFPFERFNGLLGAYNTNKKSIEKQIMKKFLREQAVRVMPFPDNAKEYQDVLQLKQVSKGSVKETENAIHTFSLMNLATVCEFEAVSFQVSGSDPKIKMIPPLYNKVLSSRDTIQLQAIYKQLYPQLSISFMSRFYHRCKRVVLGNEVLGSTNVKQAVIMAYWPGTGCSLANIDYTQCRVGVVQNFIKHTVSFAPDGRNAEHLFCFVSWKQRHPFHDWFGHSAIVASTDTEVEDACCFMPVQRIAYRCAHGQISLNFGAHTETVFVASPIALKFCI